MNLKAVVTLIILPAILTHNAVGQKIDSLVDSRDNKVYRTVVIGNQTWMAENLAFQTPNSWCYENKPENGIKYGRLYTWEAANKACPTGWHLPTDNEWKALEKFLGMTEADLEKNDKWRGTDQGARLISDKSVGFNVIFSGYRNPPSNFYLEGMQAFFWTATPDYESAWFRQFYNKSNQIFRRSRPNSWAFSVRCVKD